MFRLTRSGFWFFGNAVIRPKTPVSDLQRSTVSSGAGSSIDTLEMANRAGRPSVI